MQRTYLAAIRDMLGDASEVINVVRDSAGLVMDSESKHALEAIDQEIIEVQEAVLALQKAKQARSVSAVDYAAQIQEYSQRMQQLEERQQSLKTADIKYAEVKLWLDNFERYINDGSILNVDDSTVLKQLVDQIVVGDAGIEIQFKCGVMLEKEYE